VLADWPEGRNGLPVSYQFWTDSGERSECHGKVVSNEELTIEKDSLKVFYLPKEPIKSVAPCRTSLRIRVG
jgi:hypothetical protein